MRHGTRGRRARAARAAPGRSSRRKYGQWSRRTPRLALLVTHRDSVRRMLGDPSRSRHGSPSLPRPLLTVSAAHVLRADLSVASPSISPSSTDAFLVDSGATTRCPELAIYHLEHVLSASVCVTSSVLCNVDQDSPERSRDSVTGRVMVRSQCAHTPEDNLHRSDKQDIGGDC